ncbi:hypothetical protein BV360_05578 [Pseudomonas syringae pv. actinidiae]|nr:hypothetical protein BV360_05578 [Pseudomonas syringae pv. actinidiae]OSO52552.1 hypothetical protein BV366_05658 [Pseudomonas syringae pv. actinidiae]
MFYNKKPFCGDSDILQRYAVIIWYYWTLIRDLFGRNCF